MTDSIANLIAAAREAREYLVFVANRGLCATTNYSTVLQRHIAELGAAIAAAKAAAEARPEPKPEDRNWPEDATHENGNYQNKCALCWNQFVGHKGRVACKVCATERPIDTMTMVAAFNQGSARPDPAAEPGEVTGIVDRAREDWRIYGERGTGFALLCDAIKTLDEALARQVRR